MIAVRPHTMQHVTVMILVQKCGLISAGWDALATWPFVDFVFNQPSDWFQHSNKLKQAGLHGLLVDTDKVLQLLHQVTAALHVARHPGSALKANQSYKRSKTYIAL